MTQPIDQSASLYQVAPDADIDALRKHLSTMIDRLNDIMSERGFAINSLSSGNITYVRLEKLISAPSGPQPGMVVYADGVLWDPGSGEGFYGYKADNTWHKII